MSKEIVPAAPDGLMKYTYDRLIFLWLENFANNLKQIRKGLDLAELPKKKGEPCICIGAGPSLVRYNHLNQIRKAKWKHPILCCDRKLKDCLEHNSIPYLVATVDGSPMVSQFYKHKIIRQHSKQINAAFSSTIHPLVVKAWKGKIYWFTAMLPGMLEDGEKINTQSPTFILHLLSNHKSIISAIGNVGSFLWNIGFALECDPLILVGYDFSEQVRDKADAVYFKAFTRMFIPHCEGDIKKAMDKAADLHQVEKNPDFNTFYLVNPIWKRYRNILRDHIVASEKNTVNCTGNGPLHTEAVKCKNFKAMTLQEALEKYN